MSDPFTFEEWRVTEIALRDYLTESERYLRGVRPTDSHDPCCEQDRGRRARLAEQERDLQQRVDAVRAALAKVRAARTRPREDHSRNSDETGADVCTSCDGPWPCPNAEGSPS